jgi:hypothetical protein
MGLTKIEGLGPYSTTKVEEDIAHDLDAGMDIEALAEKHFPVAYANDDYRERAIQATLSAITRMQDRKEGKV